MKILTGYHFPSRGVALVGGISVQDNPVEVKKRIGYLPENVPVYGELTVDEYLSFIADARLIADRQKAKEAAVVSCGLEQVTGKKIETLSKGYKQRVGLAQAIIHDPPILILDEPTSGLDPNQIIEIRSLIKKLGERKTVILSTHILQEVEAVCSQVLILSEGHIAAQGTPEEIAGNLKGTDTWDIMLKGADVEMIKEKLSRLVSIAHSNEIKLNTVADVGNGVVKASFSVAAGGTGYGVDGERIFDWAVAEQIKILGMNQKKISLEDIFVRLTTETQTADVDQTRVASSEAVQDAEMTAKEES
jgi:ABC-2 type transport system ATP-binding protein